MKGEKFRLETFRDKYITQDYVHWLRSKEINKLIIHSGENITFEEVRNYCNTLLDSQDNIFLAIVINEDNKHIGNVRLGPIDFHSHKCSFGLMIGDLNYHGKGIGTEVVTLFIKYVFEELKMHKLYLGVWDHNKADIRIYEKNQFVEECILKDHTFKNNRHFDLRMMALFNPREKSL